MCLYSRRDVSVWYGYVVLHIQNGVPGLAAPDPAFTTIVVLRSSHDGPMVKFVRKLLLGSLARDIEIHWWSCILRVSSDGRWSKTEVAFEKVPYFYIDRVPSPIDSQYQFECNMHGASLVPATPIMYTRVIYGIAEGSSRHIWSRFTPIDGHFARASSKRRQMTV